MAERNYNLVLNQDVTNKKLVIQVVQDTAANEEIIVYELEKDKEPVQIHEFLMNYELSIKKLIPAKLNVGYVAVHKLANEPLNQGSITGLGELRGYSSITGVNGSINPIITGYNLNKNTNQSLSISSNKIPNKSVELPIRIINVTDTTQNYNFAVSHSIWNFSSNSETITIPIISTFNDEPIGFTIDNTIDNSWMRGLSTIDTDFNGIDDGITCILDANTTNQSREQLITVRQNGSNKTLTFKISQSKYEAPYSNRARLNTFHIGPDFGTYSLINQDIVPLTPSTITLFSASKHEQETDTTTFIKSWLNISVGSSGTHDIVKQISLREFSTDKFKCVFEYASPNGEINSDIVEMYATNTFSLSMPKNMTDINGMYHENVFRDGNAFSLLYEFIFTDGHVQLGSVSVN